MKAFICVFMAVLLSNIPHVAAAEVAREMIPTAIVVEEMSRAQAQSNIEEILQQPDVRGKLADLGLSQDEITKRLATLSDSEIRQMAVQIDQARFGGQLEGILIIVALVLLIIFLAKRI